MPIIDRYSTQAHGLSSPAEDGFAITPHDSNELARTTRAIYVGGAGTVALVTHKGTAITFVGVPAGAVLPIRAAKVLLTGTTATNLIGLD